MQTVAVCPSAVLPPAASTRVRSCRARIGGHRRVAVMAVAGLDSTVCFKRLQDKYS